jgi:hypothetical protein
MPEGLQAGGNISPKRIVRLSSAAGSNKVTQAAAATTPFYGISGQGTRWAAIEGTSLNDGYHAISGENCKVFVIGDAAPLNLGGTVNAGDLITSNGSGQGIATTTDANFVIGTALQSGVSGEDIMVRIQPGQRAS